MLSRETWNDLVVATGTIKADTRLVMPIRRSTQGASRAFLGRASDGRQYWIKVPRSGECRGLAAEQIVGRLGDLIAAPTCRVATIEVTTDLDWEYESGRKLQPCVAHGCQHVEDAIETHAMDRPTDDENAVRYTGAAALYDWAFGDDIQGLHVVSDQFKFYSHDHGRYLPPGKGEWRAKVVEDYADTPHELAEVALDGREALRIAKRLEDVNRDEIRIILQHVPDGWGIPSKDLESVGYYLERRATQVASRLRQRIGERS